MTNALQALQTSSNVPAITQTSKDEVKLLLYANPFLLHIITIKRFYPT